MTLTHTAFALDDLINCVGYPKLLRLIAELAERDAEHAVTALNDGVRAAALASVAIRLKAAADDFAL